MLFLPPVVRATDASGNALSGAKRYFYVSGGLVPATTYTTSALSPLAVHAHPVVADGGGLFAPIYLDPGVTYRMIERKANGDLIQDVDPYNAPLDAGSIDFDPGWTGSEERDLEARMTDTVSILDFIPVAEHAAIKARTSTTDLAAYYNAAIAHIDSVGGGELYIPAGRYRCGSTVSLCKKLHIRGASRGGAHIQFTHAGTTVGNGSGFKSFWASNSATPANIFISDLWVEMTHASNVGAGFYDNGGHYIKLRDSTFSGGKYGVIFDQTEVSGIFGCELAGQLNGGAGLWIVNGGDIEPANQGGYTNQISVDQNCQFNQSSGAHAIIDDGGDSHYFGNNNINGGGCRFTGVANLTIMGGEFEAVNGRPTITFASTTSGGASIGGCHAVIINPLIVQPAGQPCITITSMYSLTLFRAQLTATAVAGSPTACVTGLSNCGSFRGFLNVNPNTDRPILDGYANGGHKEDENVAIRPLTGTAHTLNDAIYYNAHLRTTNDSAVAITIPNTSTFPFPIGTRLWIEQAGAGAVTVTVAGGGTVTGTATTAGAGQQLALVHTSANNWLSARLT